MINMEVERLRYARAMGIPRLEGERAMLAGQLMREKRQKKIRRKRFRIFFQVFFAGIFWLAILAGFSLIGNFVG